MERIPLYNRPGPGHPWSVMVPSMVHVVLPGVLLHHWSKFRNHLFKLVCSLESQLRLNASAFNTQNEIPGKCSLPLPKKKHIFDNSILSQKKSLTQVFSACVAISCGQLASWNNLVQGNAVRPQVNHASGAAIHPTAKAVQPTPRAVQPVAAHIHKGLVEHPNGAVVPAEPADVVAAKRAHLQLASVPIAYILEDNLFVYPNGVIVPAEGAEVMAARRAHLAALANAS